MPCAVFDDILAGALTAGAARSVEAGFAPATIDRIAFRSMPVNLDSARVRSMGELIGLDIPESDLEAITLRLDGLLSAMDEIERELGAEMDEVDPIPPVFAREDW